MNPILDDLDREKEEKPYWRVFIGPQAPYYIQQWNRMQQQGSWWSFNPAAFFLHIIWLLYRRMIRFAVLIFSIFLAEGFVEILLFRAAGILPPAWWPLVRLSVFALLLGFVGNWLYLLHTREQVRYVLQSFPGEQQTAELRRRGGVAWWPVAVFVLLVVLFFAHSR